METRVLRSRKSTSSDAGGDKKSEETKPSPVKRTDSSSSSPRKQGRANSNASSSNEVYPQLPLFGLSELMSGVGNLNDEDDDDVEEEEEEEEDQVEGEEVGDTSLVQKKKRVRNPPKEPVICPDCGKHFTRKAHLVRHMYLHTGEKPFKCNFQGCTQSFNRKDHLGAHVRVCVLKDQGKHQKTFKPAAAVSSPRRTSTVVAASSKVSPSIGFKILTCSVCSKRFTQEHLYQAHLLTHSKQKPNLPGTSFNKNAANVAVNQYPTMEEEDQYVDELPDEEYSEEVNEGEEYFENEEEADGAHNESLTKEEIERMLEQQSEAKKRFECVVCAKVFKEQRSLRRHYKLHRRNFVCRFCGVKMSSAGSLMRHNLLHTGEKPFECPLCFRQFSRKDALKAHLAAHDKESTKVQLARPYKCNFCTARYTMRYNLVRHLRQAHPGHRATVPILQQNPQIQKQVPKFEASNEVEEDESEENSLQCKHCNKIFANAKSLSTHQWYHNQEKRFICKICKHGFKYATDLSRHILTHRTKKPENSMKTFAQNRLAHAKQTISRNVAPPAAAAPVQRATPTHNSIVVNGQRLYPCGVCGQIFNHRSNRSRHMRLFHKGNNNPTATGQAQQRQRQPPANSKAIQQSFVRAAMNMKQRNLQRLRAQPTAASSSGLAEQIAQQQIAAKIAAEGTLVEDDEPPNENGLFKCNICDKEFNKRYNHKLHLRTHFKQFLCVVCGLRTASQGDLTLHLRTHTGEKPFQCSACSWRFCRRSALTVHYRRHHGPNAKIKRHYNPQRVTPNMMQSDDADDAMQLVDTTLYENEAEDVDDGSILKTMLVNEEHDNDVVPQTSSSSFRQPQQQQQRPPRKNLPPPPPLIRYPTSQFSSLKNAITVHKVEEEKGKVVKNENPSDEVFLCRPCGSLIPGKDEYVNHMYEEHGTSVAIDSPNQKQKNITPPQMQQRPKLTQKPQQQQLQAMPCRQCGEIFGSRHDMTVHVLVAHSTSGPVCCGVCKKLGTSIEFLSRHYRYLHPEEQNAAEEARILLLNTFSQDDDPDEMYQDSNSQEAAANLLCPEVVLKEETENNEQADEVYEEEYEEDYGAPETAMESEAKDQLPQSSRTSTDPNLPFPCPLCNKCFKDKKALADHKWYHSREAIHPCTICGKRFKLKNDLIRHHRRHLQERPNQCPKPKQLESMPYSCQHCSIRFSQIAILIRHMRTSHPSEDISQLLILQSHAQKRTAEEKEMQNYLSNLEDQTQPQGNGDNQEEDDGTKKDYSFELQQLEIDMSTEEEGVNEDYLYQQQSADDNGMFAVSAELDIQETEEGDYSQFYEENQWQQEEDDQDMQGTSSSILQPCMKKLEEYTNERGELFCKPCNKPFKDLKTLQNHVYYHQRECKHPCTHCGAKFKQKSDLRRHIGIHHDPNKKRQCIACPNCNRSFTDERYLRIHLNKNCEGTAENESPQDFQQYDLGDEEEGVVGEEYDDDEQQQVQGEWEEEPDPLMFVASNLQVEGGGEDGTWNMEENEEMEGEEQDTEYQVQQQHAFECDICGEYFSRSNELILHQRTHNTKAKTFPFTSSSAGSSSSANKKTKTFTCDKCGMNFTQKAELTQHLQLYHLDELPIHQCSFCPKYFYVKKSLQTHLRRHHSDLMNLHPCTVCGARFSQKEYLQTHLRSHHSNVR